MRIPARRCLIVTVTGLFLYFFPATFCFGQEKPSSASPSPLSPSTQEPLQQGQQLLIQGDLDGAARAFEKILDKTPLHPEANYYLGLIHLQKNEMEEAIQRFEKVLATNPNHLESHYNIGLARKVLMRLDEAIGSFKKVIEIEPRYFPVYFELGDLYERQERVEEAVLSFRAVVEVAGEIPEAQEIVRQARARLVQLGEAPEVARQVLELYQKAQGVMKEGDMDKASRLLHEILDRIPQHVVARFLLAQVHLRQGQNIEALKRLEEAVKIDPQAWRIFILLAQTYAAQGLLEEAIAAYTAAAALLGKGPLFEDIRSEVLTLREVKEERDRLEQLRERLPLRQARNLFNQGIALLRDGKTEEAVVQLKQAVEKNPNNPFYHYNLGIAYFNQQNLILATQSLLKALDLNDKYGPAHFFLGLVYNASGDAGRSQGDLVGANVEYRKAAEELNKALELGMEEWAVDEARSRLARMETAVALFQESMGHTVLATAFLDRKDYENALREYQIAAELVPQDPVSRISIGQVYEILGEDEKAVRAYQEAAEASPRIPDPYVYLGLFFEKKKELEKARQAYETAIERGPNAAEPLIRLGKLLFDANELEKAQEYFQKAIQLEPRQVEPHFYMAEIFARQGHDEMARIEYEQVANALPEGNESRNYALERARELRRVVGQWSQTFSHDDNANYSKDNPQEGIWNTFNMALAYRILRLNKLHQRLPVPLTLSLDLQSSTTSLVYSENLFNSEIVTFGLQSDFLENYSLSSLYRFTYNYNDITGHNSLIHAVIGTVSRTARIPSRISLGMDFNSLDSLVSPVNDRVSYGYTAAMTQSKSLGEYGSIGLTYTFSNRDYTNIVRQIGTHSLEMNYSKASFGSLTLGYSFVTNEEGVRLEQSGKDHRFSMGYSNTLFRKLGFTTGLDYTLSSFDVPRLFRDPNGTRIIPTLETADTFSFRLATTYVLANGLNFALNYSFTLNQSNLNIARENLDLEEQLIRQQLSEPTRFFGDYRKHLISLAVSKSF